MEIGPCGCMNLGQCQSNGNCSCSLGYYGSQCEFRWRESNLVAWQAVQWTLVSLHVLLAMVCLLLIIQWLRKQNLPYGAVNRKKPVAALCSLGLSLVFGALVYGVDPYRFIASAGGYLTLSYRAGLTVISNLALSLTAVAFLFLGATWLSALTAGAGWVVEVWTRSSTVLFWITSFLCVALGFVFAGLTEVISSNTADLIYTILLGVVVLLTGMIIVIGSLRVIVSLARFREKNKSLSRRVVLHGIYWSILVVVLLAILAGASATPVNSSFSVFLYVRTFLPGMLLLLIRGALMIQFRCRSQNAPPASSPSVASETRESSLMASMEIN